MMEPSHFTSEWTTLQSQYDSYEKWSLLIKIVSVCIVAATLLSDNHNVLVLTVIGVLWLQDAIWKTFQARIQTRLLQLEEAFMQEEQTGSTAHRAYHYNLGFLQNRRSGAGLLAEYLTEALRPTVIFPYAPLILILVLDHHPFV